VGGLALLLLVLLLVLVLLLLLLLRLRVLLLLRLEHQLSHGLLLLWRLPMPRLLRLGQCSCLQLRMGVSGRSARESVGR